MTQAAVDADTIKWHPLIFTGESVRAILAGAKTQTRRLLTRSNSYIDGSRCSAATWAKLDFGSKTFRPYVDRGPSPAGNPGPYLKVAKPMEDGDQSVHRVYPQWFVGDRIWAKEVWAPADHMNGSVREDPIDIAYRADRTARRCVADGQSAIDTYAWNWERFKWKSPLFMPRWASRLALEVTEVRVQRLHEITEEDAIAEGVDAISVAEVPRNGTLCRRDDFAQLWQIINARRAPWDSNCWVYALTFRKVEGGNA